MARTVLHVDMDAFYAAIEQRDRPELRGRPVVVGADPKGGRGRGVVSTASYEARRSGVHSAMPISVAFRLCPSGVYLPVDMERYAAVSKQVMGILRRFTDRVEPVSIDEAFLDVTASERAFGSGERIATRLKAEIRDELQLTASVGVAVNKLVAKIASDMRKPDGLVVVPAGTERRFLAPLPVRRLWGVGPKLEEQLVKLGVQKIGDLQRLEPARLKRRLGSHGHDLLRLAAGEDEREVLADAGEAKSLGQEHTYEQDQADPGVLRRTLLSLSDAVAGRLRHQGLRGRTITLKYRDQGFVTRTRSETLGVPTDEGDVVFGVARRLFEGVHAGKRVRLLGIYVSGFGRGGQLELFGKQPAPADQLRDRIAARFGSDVMTRASLLRPRPRDKHT
jgi:nucleotidyltransferase/DNA polymerase involved in DNA repair